MIAFFVLLTLSCEARSVAGVRTTASPDPGASESVATPTDASRPSCPICLEEDSAGAPKLRHWLPCFHPICEGCREAILRQSTKDPAKLRCPVCRGDIVGHYLGELGVGDAAAPTPAVPIALGGTVDPPFQATAGTAEAFSAADPALRGEGLFAGGVRILSNTGAGRLMSNFTPGPVENASTASSSGSVDDLDERILERMRLEDLDERIFIDDVRRQAATPDDGEGQLSRAREGPSTTGSFYYRGPPGGGQGQLYQEGRPRAKPVLDQDAARYEGEWRNGRKNGHGIQSWRRAGRGMGKPDEVLHGRRSSWVPEMRHPSIAEARFFAPAEASRYEGQWRENLMEGGGIFSHTKRDRLMYETHLYAGEWKHGEMHGQGSHFFTWGTTRHFDLESGKYVGQFVDGTRHGYGRAERNGIFYDGEWGGGRRNGVGMMFAPSKDDSLTPAQQALKNQRTEGALLSTARRSSQKPAQQERPEAIVRDPWTGAVNLFHNKAEVPAWSRSRTENWEHPLDEQLLPAWLCLGVWRDDELHGPVWEWCPTAEFVGQYVCGMRSGRGTMLRGDDDYSFTGVGAETGPWRSPFRGAARLRTTKSEGRRGGTKRLWTTSVPVLRTRISLGGYTRSEDPIPSGRANNARGGDGEVKQLERDRDELYKNLAIAGIFGYAAGVHLAIRRGLAMLRNTARGAVETLSKVREISSDLGKKLTKKERRKRKGSGKKGKKGKGKDGKKKSKNKKGRRGGENDYSTDYSGVDGMDMGDEGLDSMLADADREGQLQRFREIDALGDAPSGKGDSQDGDQTMKPFGAPAEPLSPDEALYLAKEAGFYTRTELQDSIIRSPSFSTDKKNPFTIERFLDPLPEAPGSSSSSPAATGAATKSGSETDDVANTYGLFGENTVPRKVHDAITRVRTMASSGSSFSTTASRGEDARAGFRLRDLNAATTATFVAPGRNGHPPTEWKVAAEGFGTRARASAHCILRRGSGRIKINGEEDFTSRWPLLYNRLEVILPFTVTNSCGLFDAFLALKGGGTSGQAGAAKLAIARALAAARPGCVPLLDGRQLLHEDLRQKLPKDSSRPKARAGWRWSKR
eukprot:g881.t1